MKHFAMSAVFLLSVFALAATPAMADETQIDWESSAVPQGAKLIPEEILRGPGENGMEVSYRLRTEGLPTDKTYHVWLRNLAGYSKRMEKTLRIDSSGYVIHVDDGYLTVGARTMLEGEPMHYALISDDGNAKTFVEVIPFPIVSQEPGPCRLSAKQFMPEGKAWLVEGRGYKPGQKLKMVAQSGNEVIEMPLRGTDDEVFTVPVSPGVKGQTGGETSVKISDSDCTASVRFKWGDALKVYGTDLDKMPLPQDSFLKDKVLEVGRSLGWSLAYENRDEGLFVWRFKSECATASSSGCEGVFTWYIKRVENKIALHDPVMFTPECMKGAQSPQAATACVTKEAQRYQEEFKRRWLELSGPIMLTGPTLATHSPKLENEARFRVLRETGKIPDSAPADR